jgi:hypothetical protein
MLSASASALDSTRMQKNPDNQKLRPTIVVLTLAVVFLVGVILLIVSSSWLDQEPWGTTLDVIGGFLSISVAVSFLYQVTLKPADEATRRNEIGAILDPE